MLFEADWKLQKVIRKFTHSIVSVTICHSVPSSVLGTHNTEVNKRVRSLALMQLTLFFRMKANKIN